VRNEKEDDISECWNILNGMQGRDPNTSNINNTSKQAGQLMAGDGFGPLEDAAALK
jgi:hypothetical protein